MVITHVLYHMIGLKIDIGVCHIISRNFLLVAVVRGSKVIQRPDLDLSVSRCPIHMTGLKLGIGECHVIL